MFRFVIAGVLSVVLLAGCMSPKGETADEKRQSVEQMRSEALADLYEVQPYAQAQIAEAAGYGVISNFGVNLFLLSTASGWVVVHVNGAGNNT